MISIKAPGARRASLFYSPRPLSDSAAADAQAASPRSANIALWFAFTVLPTINLYEVVSYLQVRDLNKSLMYLYPCGR